MVEPALPSLSQPHPASRKQVIGFWWLWVVTALTACLLAAVVTFMIVMPQISDEKLAGFHALKAMSPYYSWVVLWCFAGPLAVGISHSFLLRNRVGRSWVWAFTMLAWIPFFFYITSFSPLHENRNTPIQELHINIKVLSNAFLTLAAGGALFALIGGVIFAYLQWRLLRYPVSYSEYVLATAGGILFGWLFGFVMDIAVIAALRLLLPQDLAGSNFYLALFFLVLFSVLITSTAAAQGRIIAR